MGSDAHTLSHHERLAELERFRACVDASPDLLFVLSLATGRICEVNQTACDRLGQSRDTLLGSTASQWFQDSRTQFETVLEQLSADRDGSATMVTDLIGRNNHHFPAELVIHHATIQGEHVALVAGRDITDRHLTRQALLESEARLNSIFRAAPTGIGVVANRVLLQVNERICQMTGYTTEELVGQQSRILYLSDEDFEYVGREKYRQIREFGTGTVETRWRRKDGSVIHVLLSSTPIVPEDLSIGVTFTALDITDRKQAEEALEKRLIALTQPLATEEPIDFETLFNLEDIQTLQDLFAEATGVASIITKPDGTPITKPSNFCRLCNDVIRQTAQGRKNCYHSDAVIGRHNPGGSIVQTCLSGGLWDAGASVAVGGQHIANWLIGQVRSEAQDEETALRYAKEIGADLDAFREAFREVPTMSETEFGRVAKALFVFANQLSTLAYQNIQQARFITDRKRAEKSLVHEKAFSDSVIDTLPGIFYLFDRSGRLLRWNDNFERVSGYSAEELRSVEPWDFFTGDDKRAIAEQIDVAFATGQASATANLVSKDGHSTPYFFTGVRVILDEVPLLAGTGLDITERKQAESEREQLIAELEARNAELERFTYTVSHDLKSPLITIKGYIGVLAEDLHEGNTANVKEDIQRIAKSADKMATLLKDLLELSRVGRIVTPPTEVPMGELAQEAVQAVGGPIAERGVRVEIAPDLPVAYGDRQRLLEVLQNLIENAVKYMGSQVEPTIRLGAELSDGMVLVHVQDNGIGIAPRYHEQIFGLFDQLDGRTDGTGIGLALAKRIVEVHGGRIWVESEGEGAGSRLCFTVPAPPLADA